MPPKRDQKPSTQTRGKKNKTTSGIPKVAQYLLMDAELHSNNQPSSTIDYDKWAITIIKNSLKPTLSPYESAIVFNTTRMNDAINPVLFDTVVCNAKAITPIPDALIMSNTNHKLHQNIQKLFFFFVKYCIIWKF